MASINVSRATSTLTSPAFVKSAVLIVAGSLLAQIVVSQMRENVRDINVQGGDAVYALVAALLALTALPGRYGRPIALGSTASAVRVVAREFGII